MRIQTDNIDVIALTEIKPKHSRYPLQLTELQINGYDTWPSIETDGRGVVIYTKKHLKASERIMTQAAGYNDSAWCHINLANRDKLLIGAYIDPQIAHLQTTKC